VVYLTDYAEKHGYYRENSCFQEDFAVRGEEKTVGVKGVTRRERELGGLLLKPSQGDMVYKGVINIGFDGDPILTASKSRYRL
jgi:hypothetical protein